MWKLREIVLGAILCVVCGVVYMGWDQLSMILPTSISPTLLGLMNGVWWIASGLVAYIVRRPGAALFAGFVSAFFEYAFASPYGPAAMISGLLQGGFMEIGLLFFLWRRYNGFSLAFAAAFGGIGNIIQWYAQYQGASYSVSGQIGYIVMTLISGAILAGLLPKWIADALNRTGSLRNFEIGKQSRA